MRSAAAAAFVLALSWQAGCRNKPQVSLEVAIPSAISDKTKWIEIGVFGGTSCATVSSLLPGGIPPEGSAARLAFDRKRTPPALGDLPKARYAFAAVGKDENCGVVAHGCTDVDVEVETSVAISLRAVNNGAQPCAGGTRCLSGRCVPGNDLSDPAIGADCSLDLLGAGPLGDPIGTGAILVSAPAVVPTASGFLIGYRQFDPSGGQAFGSFVLVDNSGGARAAPLHALSARCSSSDENDAMSMAFSSDNNAGLAVLSRAACNTNPSGTDQLLIDGTGMVGLTGFDGLGESRRLLSNAHALAYDAKGNHFLLAFTQDKEAEIVFANGNKLEPGTPIKFGGQGPKTGAWVVVSDSVRAFLAAGTGGDLPLPADGGTDSGPPTLDAGTGGSTLRLQVISASSDPSTLTATPVQSTFPGTWGSIAATGGLVVVASDGTNPTKQVTFRVFDAAGISAAPRGTEIVVDGPGKIAYADVAISPDRDRLLFAIEKASPPTGSTIVLRAFTQATTTPVPKSPVFLSKDARIPTLGALRDGNIAVAATDTRVAVAWTTGKNLTDKDTVGGYALFACSR